jgi:hypothetical protein
MREGLPAALAGAAPGGGTDCGLRVVAAAATAALARGAARLDAAAAALLSAAGATSAAAAAHHLAQLRGVAATFRVTARPPPSRAAPYASACLGPLAAMLGGGAPSPPASLPGARSLSPAARQALAAHAVSGIAARLEALAGDLLASLRKAEASLARLKAGRPGAAFAAAAAPPATAALSDADKVAAQVFLDVLAFGRAAEGLVGAGGGAGVASLPAFRSLWSAAAPEGRKGVVDLGGAVEAGGPAVAAPAAVAAVAAPPPPAPVVEGGGGDGLL